MSWTIGRRIRIDSVNSWYSTAVQQIIIIHFFHSPWLPLSRFPNNHQCHGNPMKLDFREIVIILNLKRFGHWVTTLDCRNSALGIWYHTACYINHKSKSNANWRWHREFLDQLVQGFELFLWLGFIASKKRVKILKCHPVLFCRLFKIFLY